MGETIGEGKSIKNFIDSTRDLTNFTSNHLNAHLRQENMTNMMFTSGPGSKLTNFKSEKGNAKQQLSKRKKEFDIAKDKIMKHLDLTKRMEPPQGGKLYKNVQTCRAAKKKVTKDQETVPSLRELLKMKENSVNPLNYSCDFSRLTQLFQRPLQIKYYAKKT